MRSGKIIGDIGNVVIYVIAGALPVEKPIIGVDNDIIFYSKITKPSRNTSPTIVARVITYNSSASGCVYKNAKLSKGIRTMEIIYNVIPNKRKAFYEKL